MCYVVCSSVSLLSLYCVCSLYVGKGEVKSSGEIRGQRPHGRKRPPHAVWGLAPSLQAAYLYQEVFFFCYWHEVSKQNDATFR